MDALIQSKAVAALKVKEQTCQRSCRFTCCADAAERVNKDLEARTWKDADVVWSWVSDFNVVMCHSE